MAKRDITAIAATFVNLVEVMYPQMVKKRAEMLNGALDGLISKLVPTGEEQVAARSVGDMSKDTTRTV